jgi:hypothetical protein
MHFTLPDELPFAVFDCRSLSEGSSLFQPEADQPLAGAIRCRRLAASYWLLADDPRLMIDDWRLMIEDNEVRATLDFIAGWRLETDD